jgi:hypothetical protein
MVEIYRLVFDKGKSLAVLGVLEDDPSVNDRFCFAVDLLPGMNITW